MTSRGSPTVAAGSLAAAILLSVHASPTQATEGGITLEAVMRQIEALKREYEQRIARLERQKQADSERIARLERQKRSDDERIASLERSLTRPEPTLIATPEPPAPRTPVASDPKPTVTATPVGAGTPRTARPSPQVEPPAQSALSLTGGGATLIDETDGPVPFSLNAKVALETRYSYFSRSNAYWTPNNNSPEAIHDYSVIELNRAMLAFGGYALTKALTYDFILYASTAAGSLTPLGYIGYHWMPEIRTKIGIWKAPGTREWSESWASTLGIDRSMATTYFRPNWTPGAWVEGTFDKALHYQVFVGNSFGGMPQNYESDRLGTGMLYAINTFWEPFGEMGQGVSDLQDHASPVWRLGATGVYQHVHDTQAGYDAGNPDSTIFRLSNGTPLSLSGALGPGTLLDSAQVYLATLDTAVKYSGFALYAEFMYRHLGDFGYAGPAPEVSALNDFGGVLQGSYFLLPNSLEMYGRSSIVSGRYGTPWEAGGGFNWYPLARIPNWVMTAEALYIHNSPAENLLTPYRAGQRGVVGQVEVKLLF
ncbi:hypothetical protein [Methylotetracoccus oryzae]|uniref:hypothetical protein n=1 Tax=Methylotetracoccus oryzae TaxID=1919059 RepID=UPI001118EDE6|nr:hypothetical protein [Methylotetracoccus oryzae]